MKEKLESFLSKYRNIHVVGISGQEGRAIFDYLLAWRPEIVVGHESSPEVDFRASFMRFSDAYAKEEAETMLSRFLSSRARINFGSDYLKEIVSGDLIIVPQAWRRYEQNKPLFNLPEGIHLKQAIEIVLMVIGCPTIGVTGTAGKSTTTTLISSILKEAGKSFYFSGNDRENKWDLFQAEKLSSGDVAILEISHRHLADIKVSPRIAVLTNIYPHHLDDAGSYENYVFIKKNIFRFQSSADTAVVNEALLSSGEVIHSEVPGKLLVFGHTSSADARFDGSSIIFGGEEIVRLDDFVFKGEHNALNAAASALAASALGIGGDVIRRGLLNARPLKHRMEKVGERDGLVFWNDGKSTDPIATIEAVKSIPNLLALFLGGAREGGKSGDFAALGEEIVKRKIPRIFVYGRSGKLILDDLINSGVPESDISVEENLKAAVISALKYVFGKTGSVLFSPACQSFDEFKDYRERAETFNSAVITFIGK